MDQHQQQLPHVLTISPPTPFQVSKVSYVIPIYRVKASPCRLLHQAQEKIHVSLPMSLPTSNAFSLERPIRCSVKSARVEAITVIIPVQRLDKIIKRKTHAMQSRHPITAYSLSPFVSSSCCCSRQVSTPELEVVRVPRHRPLRRVWERSDASFPSYRLLMHPKRRFRA
jgi:hypothetical protein